MRILSVLVWSSVLGLLGWFFHDMHERREEERRLRQAISALTEETPCARILVNAVEKDPATGKTSISMSWLDTDADWQPRPGAKIREISVDGREAYFDTYQVIFDSDDVKEADPLRGKTLTVFSRVFGSSQSADDGVPLNMPGNVLDLAKEGGDMIPPHYRLGAEVSELETRLWSKWWELCTNPEAAEREGIRTVQGTAVHKPLVAKMEYRLSINNQGQIFLDGPRTPDPFVKQ